jgi:YD repeat-containing protein
MVAIVTGNSFGIARSSAAVLGAQGQFGLAQMGRGNDRVYVDAATGNLVINRTDEVLTGQGPDEDFGLTYNSQDPSTLSGTAFAWNIGTYQRIVNVTGTVNTAGSTATRIASDGSATTFTYDATKGYYTSQDGTGPANELRFAAGTNIWTWTDGASRATEQFGTVAGFIFLTAVTDADGNTQSYTYNTSGMLTRITEANGDYSDITWTGARPTQVTTSSTNASGLQTETRVRYTWDASYRLTSATIDLSPQDNNIADGNVYTTSYTYDGTSLRVSSITQTDGSRLDIGYTQSGATYLVTSLTETVASGVTRVTGLYYDLVNKATMITDPLGGVTTMRYDASGNLTQIVQPAPMPGAAAPTASFTYDGNGHVTSTTANGLTTVFQYDPNGNLAFTRDAAGNTITRGYGAKN